MANALCKVFTFRGHRGQKKNKCLFDVADKSVTDNKDCVCFVLYLNKKKNKMRLLRKKDTNDYSDNFFIKMYER